MRKPMPVNIPNLLTLLRYALVPVYLWSFFALPSWEGGHPISAGILLFSGITDVLDGVIARKYGMTSEWGKTHDPLADKLTQAAAILSIWYMAPRFWPFYTLLLLKEAAIVLGGLRLYKTSSRVYSAKWFGKLSTVVFYIAALIIIYIGHLSEAVLVGLLVIVVAFMLFSVIKYGAIYRKNMRAAKTDDKQNL